MDRWKPGSIFYLKKSVNDAFEITLMSPFMIHLWRNATYLLALLMSLEKIL